MDLRPLIGAVLEPPHDVLQPTGRGTRSSTGAGRRVVAPSGIVEFEPAEMTLRCGAGTPLEEVHAAVAERNQEVALPHGGTVGGALAVGHSDVLRRGRGPIRDTVLQVRFVTAAGTEVKAGGPTVKNVSGFDLCRLLVGSHGTLCVLGEVILRTRPRPMCRRWFRSEAPPEVLTARLLRPVSVLWDGESCWVCLEGHPDDVADECRRASLAEVADPPELPGGGRWSVAPSRWPEVAGTGRFVMELGVGVVHHERRADPSRDPVTTSSVRVRALNDRIRQHFDPHRRLNPHVDLFGG